VYVKYFPVLNNKPEGKKTFVTREELSIHLQVRYCNAKYKMLRHCLVPTSHIKTRYTSLHFNYSYINYVSTTTVLKALRSLRLSKIRILGSRGRIPLEVRMYIFFSLLCCYRKHGGFRWADLSSRESCKICKDS
jgi:hypothetical protein